MSTESSSEVRMATVLIADIADTVGFRVRHGEAPAEAKIRTLLGEIIEISRARGGHFIKSYGDDVLAVFEGMAVSPAAEAGVAMQRAALRAGLQLYVGLHPGEVEFRTTMGHPDAVGLTISIAARLHKLTEGVPGRIFMMESSVEALSIALKSKASPFGTREIKGIGLARIWTLNWRDETTNPQTVFVGETGSGQQVSLQLRHRERCLSLAPDSARVNVGRGFGSALCLPDPELRISSAHLMFEHADGSWFVQDISRNGTWLRDARSQRVTSLPRSAKWPLPISGTLCLGRPFADDPEGRYTVDFELQYEQAAAADGSS